MERNIMATALLATSFNAMAAPSGWLTVGESAFAALRAHGHQVTIRANRPARPARQDEPVYLIEVPVREVPRIAMTLHRSLRHCGGFMFHASEAEALATLDAGLQAPPRVTRPAYLISQQATVAPLLAQMKAARIARTIGQLAAFVNRYYSSEHGARAAEWLRASWSELAAAHGGITVETFSHGGYGQRSVIATIAGSERAAEVLVLGAHLDSISLASERNNAPAPGADDDASGVAGLSEVLRVLAANKYRPRRTIKLIAYAAEEVGLRGSQDIARTYRKNKVDVVGVLQLDMTNFKGSAQDIYLITDYTDAGQNAFLQRLVDTYLPGVTVGSDKCGYACSDHAAWSALGYVTSMPFEARLRQDNPHIHSQHDTYANSGAQAEHALKFARMAAAFAIEIGSEAK